ncbi:MAG: hypothetical protein LUC41_04570 [Clostridiales bacterium]|nr:hypothetical protein [Clostridiales bacterium]
MRKRERDAMVRKGLKEYEAATEMTGSEREALREWVEDGNSVHDIPFMAYTEWGTPMDFLDAYRNEEEIRRDLEKLDEHGCENHLARLRGEDTLDNLREDLDEALRKADVYYRVLIRHGLLAEAEYEMAAAKSAPPVMLPSSEDGEELPFPEPEGGSYAEK